MTTIAFVGGALGVAVLALGAAFWLAYRLGAANDQRASEHADNEVKNAQLEAAIDRPGTRDELVKRLRGDGF
jgi:hypothetical protein